MVFAVPLCLVGLALVSNPSHSPFMFFIWFPEAISMPRLRGKSKRGAAWYAARGRAAREHGSPQKPRCPHLKPIVSPTPAQPTRESTLDLSPLSNPFACRIEWFDSLGNSLGFAPPPPSPPAALHLCLPPLATLLLASCHLHNPLSFSSLLRLPHLLL
jgi:hypothetical protein